jgi:hypothetical protein
MQASGSGVVDPLNLNLGIRWCEWLASLTDNFISGKGDFDIFCIKDYFGPR